MPAVSVRAVIFDLDGTLIDTAGEISAALNFALQELGRPQLALKEVEHLIGRGIVSMVERAIGTKAGDKIDLDVAVACFRAHYARTVGTRAELFPGVLEGLHLLEDAGLPMSVVTNKPRFFTERLLDHLELAHFFAGVVAGDDGIPRKPHGDMLQAACRAMKSAPPASLMIGDSDNDVLAARAAGCPVWCVPYGYNEGRGPQTLQCDRLVDTVADAARLLAAAPL